MSDRRSIPFDRIADRYDQTRGGMERGRRVAGDLAGVLDARAPVLEIGIGTGLVALGMTERGFAVHGVDLAMPMAARAVERIGTRVALADAHRLPVADGSIAQAYSSWLLHLVADPGAVIAEVARALRPGGVYVDVVGGWTEPEPIATALDGVLERLRARAWSDARDTDGVVAHARAAGLATEVREGMALAWTESPHGIARALEARTYSYLWDLDDETWAAEVEPAIERLCALPDEPLTRAMSDRLVVMRRAA